MTQYRCPVPEQLLCHLSPAPPAPSGPEHLQQPWDRGQLPWDVCAAPAQPLLQCGISRGSAGGSGDNSRLLRDEARWAGELVPAAGAIPRQHLSGKINA